MEQLIPIPTLHLFKVLDELLFELLTSSSPDDYYTARDSPETFYKGDIIFYSN
jgi:hypothetical protein